MTVSYWELPRRVKPTVAWRGYAAIMMRPVMPLARFFYGNTHKWYFRTAGTALAATLVTAIGVRFTGDARWVAYLLSFAGVSVVYWLLYAPAKWATKDCTLGREHNTEPSMFYAPAMGPKVIREIVFGEPRDETEEYSEEMAVPSEIELLHRYRMLGGRRRETGDYLYQREWRPPGYWPGSKEYTELLDAAESHKGILSSLLLAEGEWLASAFKNMRTSGHKPVRHAIETLTLALYLDGCRPNWRRHAKLWSEKRWRRALMWSLWRHEPLRV